MAQRKQVLNQNGGRSQKKGFDRVIRKLAMETERDRRGTSPTKMLLAVLYGMDPEELDQLLLKHLGDPGIFKNVMDRVDGPVTNKQENTGESVIRVVYDKPDDSGE